jgi:hypothetical protein
MIRAVVNRASSGDIIGFEVSGHSGYAEAGKDIVCAAVSAIVQTAILGLTDVVGIEVVYDQRPGEVRCSVPEGLSQGLREKANIVLETMLCGLKSIQEGYGTYIKVEERRLR